MPRKSAPESDDESDVTAAPTLLVSLYGKAPQETVQLHPDLTPPELSSCLSQLFAKQLLKQGIDGVHGLYNGSTFTPLSIVISDPSLHNTTLSILPSSAEPAPKKVSKGMFDDPKVLVGAGVGLLVAYVTGIFTALIQWSATGSSPSPRNPHITPTPLNTPPLVPLVLVDALIETPLKHVYRNGPSAFGWEGLSFPQICSRITFHGDEAFWSKNLPECKRIFYAKEAAVMTLCKPVLYSGLIGVAIYLALAFVRASAVSKPDPDMVATFKAFKTLGKQFGGKK